MKSPVWNPSVSSHFSTRLSAHKQRQCLTDLWFPSGCHRICYILNKDAILFCNGCIFSTLESKALHLQPLTFSASNTHICQIGGLSTHWCHTWVPTQLNYWIPVVATSGPGFESVECTLSHLSCHRLLTSEEAPCLRQARRLSSPVLSREILVGAETLPSEQLWTRGLSIFKSLAGQSSHVGLLNCH